MNAPLHRFDRGEISLSRSHIEKKNSIIRLLLGSWTKGNKLAKFGYDFWYQPYHDVMFATEWGTPKRFKTWVYKNILLV